jgi:serine protease Do
MKRWSVACACLVIGAAAGTFVAGPLLRGQVAPPGTPQTVTNIPKEMTSYHDVVAHVLPAVVSIESQAKPKPKKKVDKQPQRRRSPFGDDSRIPDELRRFFGDMDGFQFEMPDEDQNPSPFLGLGSGFIVDPKGVVLTNYHVVDGADQVEVRLQDGRKFISKNIVSDRKTDLAIVRLDVKEPLPYLEFGNSDAMQIGDRVLAVGAPFGLTGTVTSGIVSAKGRNGFNMNMYEDFLQTDAAINPGNSGGPLVSLDGRVIGINSAIKSRTGGFQGVGLAIASNMAKNVMEQLLKNGVVHRGYLGVSIKELDPEVASRLGVHGKGVLVASVFEGSPADKAGIKPGDVITAIDHKPVTDGHEVQQVVAGLPVDKKADVKVVHDGKMKDLKVTILEQPAEFGTVRTSGPRRFREEEAETIPLDKLGAEVTTMTPQLAEQLGFKNSATGAVVTHVDPGSAAAEAGLRQGMLIVRVDKTPVESATSLRDALKKADMNKGVLLKVQSVQGGIGYLLVKPQK